MSKRVERRQSDRRELERRNYDRRKTDRKRRFRFDYKIIVILLILGAFAYLWTARNQETEYEERVILPPVYTMRPRKGDLEKTITVSGYIESEATVTVLPKISGNVEQLFAGVGDKVAAGQLLARVDSEQYRLTLEQAEASYLAAKSTYDRAKQLFEANVSSKQEYDQAKSQYDAYKSQYELAELSLQYTNVVSPMDGVVLIKHCSEGALISPAVPIVTIGDLDNLQITVKISEELYSFFAKNKADMDISCRLPALQDKEIPVKIKTIAPYVSPETKKFEVACTFTEEEAYLRPGMFSYLTFVLEERKAVHYLPYSSLVGENELWYIEEDGGTARSLEYRPVFGNEEYFQISSDLAEYEFIYEGQHFLKNGQKVNILNREEE